MQGTVLGFDGVSGTGVIAGSDGRRYNFKPAEWRGGETPTAGAPVDFESTDGAAAVGIYPIAGAHAGAARAAQPAFTPQPAYPGQAYPANPYPKSHVVAGLLALFLGAWGVHKFYLGYTNEGLILLGATIASFVLTIILIGIFGLLAIGAICFIEGVIYLTKSDAEFDQMYVQHKKAWF